ncbi:hypothetical protein Tco_0333319 [Tanacetum coccineum]
MVKTNLKSYTPPPTRKSSRIAASISPECNKSQEKLISIHTSKSDEQPEEQGEDVVSLKRTSNRKKTCASKKKITFETSEDADKDEGYNQLQKKNGKKSKKLDNQVIANEEVEENEESEKYEDKSPQKKKRKGKKAELEEGDKDASESNEEPPLRKKKFDAPSFVDVRKLKGDMLVLKGAKTASKKESVGDNRKKDNVEEKKETVKKKVVAAGKQVSVKKGKQKINEGTLVSLKEGKKDKDQGQIMVVEKGKEVVVNEKVKCDPVNILSRMSPSHLKNVLESLTTQQDMKDCLNDNLSKIKALLLDTDDKLKIGLDENPKDSFDKGNDVPEKL